MEMNKYMYIQNDPEEVPHEEILQEPQEEPQIEKKHSTELELLIDSTEIFLQATTRPEKMYVKTQLMQQAHNMITDKGNVVISGLPGEGKTFTGAMLMSLQFKKKQRLLLKNPRDWDHIDPAQIKIIFIDDMLGIYQFESGRLADWTPTLKVIQHYVDCQKLKVIIGTRANILQECRSKLSDYKIFDNVVEFSSLKLSPKEKEDMLTILLQHHKKSSKMNPSSIQECVQHFTSPIGFPLCCELFCTDESLFKRKSRFFKSPRKAFKRMNSLDNTKLVALMFLFCNKGEVPLSLLTKEKRKKSWFPARKKKSKEKEEVSEDIKEAEQLLEDITESRPMKGERPNRKHIKAIFDEFRGMYISFNEDQNLYQFTHNVIYESTGLILGEDNPRILLEVCTNNFLYQCVDLESSSFSSEQEKQEIVVIKKENFDTLAERLIQEVIENKEITRTARHPAFLDGSFVDMFTKNTMYQENEESFYTSVQAGALTNNTFLQEVVSTESPKTVKTTDKMLCQIGSCSHPLDVDQSCWKCQQKDNAMKECSQTGDLATFLILMVHGANPSSSEISGLLNNYNDGEASQNIEELQAEGRQIPLAVDSFFVEACRLGFQGTVEVLLKWMKSKGKWIPDDSNMTEAITNAYKDKKDNFIELLIREKVTPSPKCLLLATRMQPRNLSIIERTIGLLKSSRKWDPTNESIIEVVSAAFKHEQSDLIKLLQEAKVALPVRDFQYTVKNCDVSAVNISIKYWKSTNQWNFEETDLQAAVSEAFRTCKKDIIESFLNEGFQLKPIHLCQAAKYGDVDLAKIAVNHLKSSGKWNFSDSVFATAMCDAYESNKEDMIELLHEEKVMVTPKCLYWAVHNHTSQEPSLIKTTIQFLKSKSSWDPNHEDIEDAIYEAFASFKEDIVQILASEGATIPPNLFYWSVEQGCAPLVQVTINHLKSVGKWHQGDIDRDQALLKAHVCNQKDIIVLLQAEGAKTCPKCLYWAAKHRDFPFVLDTIEAIKSAGKWDRDDGEIVKGLEKVQRYYKKHVLKDTPIGSMKGKRYFEEEMFRDIMVEGVKLSPKCLYLAAKHADFPFVSDIIEAIKNAGKWDRDDAEIVKGLEEVQRYYKKHVLKDTPTGSMKGKRYFEEEMVRDIMVDVKERRPSF